MAYNKAKAEQEWLRQKAAEEQQLRELGVDEEIIQHLHTYDWEAFKKERLYYTRWAEWTPQVEELSAQQICFAAEGEEEFLDSIENEKLLRILVKADKLTLKIVLMRINGHSSKEIAVATGLSVNAVDLRLFKLRKKIIKFL